MGENSRSCRLNRFSEFMTGVVIYPTAVYASCDIGQGYPTAVYARYISLLVYPPAKRQIYNRGGA